VRTVVYVTRSFWLIDSSSSEALHSTKPSQKINKHCDKIERKINRTYKHTHSQTHTHTLHIYIYINKILLRRCHHRSLDRALLYPTQRVISVYLQTQTNGSSIAQR
jgi:hypothetical protein